MLKRKKFLSTFLPIIIAVFLGAALFLVFPTDTTTASAYDEVGPSFTAEKTKVYDKASDFAISNNVLSGLSSTALQTVGQYDTITLHIPSGVTSIASGAFNNEDNYGRRIVEVIIPDTVTTINSYAFQACQKMMHLQLGSGVTSIGTDAFNYCRKLVDIYNRSSITLTAGYAGTSKIAQYAMNIYTDSSGSSMLAKTADNYYFCQYTSTATRTIAANPNGNRSYTRNRWYLIAGPHINGLDNILPDPKGSSFTATYVNKTGTVNISSYDIAAWSFYMGYITKLVIPNCVNVIGDYAFGFSLFYKAVIQNGGSGTLYIGDQAFYLFSSISVQEGSSDYFDPDIGQATRIGQEVWLPSRTISTHSRAFYKPDSSTTATIYSAIIYPNRTVYNSNRSQVNGGEANVNSADSSSVAISNYITYPIDINYKIYDKNNNLIETYTEQRLFRANGKWGYNYVLGDYGFRANATYAQLPNIDKLNTTGTYRYSTTKWYESVSSSGFGAAQNVSTVNTKLANVNTTSIDLCMKYIERPDLVMLQDEWEYTGQTYADVESIDGLLEGTPLANTTGWNVNYVLTHNGQTVTSIKDVGDYTLTLVPDANFPTKYGTWDYNPSVSFRIIPAKVSLSDYGNFRLVDNSGALLQTGTVYIYSEESGSVPYASAQDGKTLQSNLNVTWSYTRNKEGLTGIQIERIPQNAITHEAMYTRGDYTTAPNVDGVGTYNTSVTVTPTSNYELTYTNSMDMTRRGLSFRANGDGSYTITKTWYVVALSNWFVATDAGENSAAYDAVNSVYNEVPAFGAPYLAHGEQSDISFILSFVDAKGNNVAVTGDDGVAISAWNNYINKSMPVGQYSLALRADQLTDTDGTVYPEFSTSYEFNVATNSALVDTHADTVNSVLQTQEFRYEYESGTHRLYTGAEVETEINGVLGLTINQRTGVWEGSAYDEYYSEHFAISYNLSGMASNKYYSEDELGAYAPENPGTYIVYYQVSALNYTDMVNVADDTGRRGYYFTVFIYDYVEVPYISIAVQKNSLVYTGSRVTPVVQGSDLYSIGYDASDAYINAGEHAFTLYMNDPTHYYWRLPTATEDIAQTEIDQNVTIGMEDDSQTGAVVIRYTILKAENVWNSTPNVIAWAWNGYVPETNIIRAVPRHNLYIKDNAYVNVKVSYVIFDSDKNVVVEEFETDNGVVTDETVIAQLKALDAGTYYLMAFAEETENFLGINVSGDEKVYNDDAYVSFLISQAVNRWNSTPNIVHWTWDRFDKNKNIITAVPQFGTTVNYYIYTLGEGGEKNFISFGTTDDGEEIYFFNTDSYGVVPSNVSVVLAALDAGTYYLIANVQPTSNYTGLYEIEEFTSEEDGTTNLIYPDGMSFAIFKAANKWNKSPSMSGWMWNRFSSANVSVVAEPTYKVKQNGDQVQITFVLYSVYSATDSASNVALTQAFSLVDGKLPATFNLADGTQVNVADYLNGLHRGTYYLVASVEDGGNFEELSDSAVVTVSVLTNSWVYTPAINGWVWGAFNVDNNTVTSTPLFNGTDFFGSDTAYACEQTTYYIYEMSGGVRVKVEGFEDGFKVDANGKVIDDDGTVELLKGLSAGTYYLLATVEADPSEYGDYTGINVLGEDGTAAEGYTLDYITFVVATTANSWKPTPGMSSWQYKSFIEDNFLPGTPVFTKEGVKVVYTVKSINTTGDAITVSLKYTVDEDGNIVLDSSVVDDLTALPVGTYRLSATYEGTGDYAPLDYQTTFTVLKTSNSWEQDPGMTSWSYKGYTAAGNFTAGDPYLQEDDDAVVTYKITKVGDNNFTEITFTNIADVKTQLENLQVGSYTMTAIYPGTDNYDLLNRGNITFSVNKIQNTWATAPGLTGWVYEAFNPANFTAGVPTLTESKNQDGSDAEVEYTITKDGDSTFTAITFTKLSDVQTKLEKLAVGSYTMTVIYPGTDNYYLLNPTVTFTVSQVSNSWKPSPGMTGWQYKNFSSSNFIVGTPKYGATVTYVLKGAPDGDITIIYDKDANGAITIDQTVFDKLNALPAGSYTFTATVTGTLDYGDLIYEANVTVLKATNTWKYSPGMTSWSYKGFVDNFVAGTPTYGEATEITYKVSGNGITEIVLGFVTEDGVRKLSSDTIAKLNALNVYGSYRLTAYLEGTSNYSDLDYDATFSVSEISNTWEITPGMTGWEYGEYTASSFRAGVPTLREDEDAVVTYTLYRVTKDSEGNDVDNELVKFDASNLYNFADLAVGSYKLVVEYPKTNNYSKLSQPITFSVTSATNKWTTYPGMTGWAYLGYTSGNFRAGVVAFVDATDEVVVYTLYELIAGAGNTVKEQYMTQFTESSEYDFLHLNVGNYKIHASLKGTDNYPDLIYDFEFSVTAINNTWSTSPILTGWTYGQFAESNFRAAVPTHNEAYGEDSENNPLYRSVTYTLKSGDTVIDTVEFKFNADGTLHQDTVNALKKLSANAEGESYTLDIAFEGNRNYRDLDQSITFRVTTANNTWSTTPGMTGWVYGEYTSSSFRAGVPTLREDEDAVVTYTLYSVTKDEENGTETENQIDEFDISEMYDFTTLGVGSYKLVAEYPATNNYGKLSQPITFAVTKAANRWTTNPGMTGWAYLGYVSSNFRAGVAALNDATEDDGITVAVVKYTLYSVETDGDGKETEAPIGNTFTASSLPDFNSLGAGRYKIYASLKGTTNYDELTQTVEFTVSKTNNSWTVTPGMTSWSYMAFTVEGNFTAGDPYLKEVATDKVVTYKITKVGDSGFTEITFTNIADVKTDLEGLAVGSYTMTAIYPGTDNYNELVRESITFGVNKIQNTWETAPGLTGWVYEAFDMGNFTAGIPTLTESNNEDGSAADVVYTITKTGSTDNRIEFVELVKDDANYKKINALPSGNYTLTVTYLGTDNYEALNTPVSFTVSQVANSWKPSPGMTGWQYKNFASSNFIVGTPKYIGEDESVVYTLKNDAGINITIAYSVVDGVVVVDTVAFNALNALEVGKYTFTATVTGTLDYGDLEYEATVSVMKAANTWSQDPGMTSWSYKGYTEAGNFTAGVPMLTESKNEDGSAADVVYTITKVGDSNFTEITFTNIADVKTQLENLQVGSYIMTAIYPGTDNYDLLNRGNITFSVNKIQNTWATAPVLTGWVFGSFSSDHFTAGVPTLRDDATAKVVYTVTKLDGSTFTLDYDVNEETGAVTLTKASIDALNALGCGNYSMAVTYPATDNYDPLNAPVNFTVSQVSNSWQPSPGMTGWQYKNFSSSNFIVGTPKYGTTVTYKLNNITITYSLDEDGAVVIDDVAFNAINALAVGKYTFTATVEGTTDYGDLEYEATVSVMKAANTWATAPVLTGWVYGSFSSDSFTAGVPTLRDDATAKVVYTVTKLDGSKFTLDYDVNEETGAVTLTKASIDKLNALGRGNYSMAVTYPATENYDPLNAPVSFTVSQVANSWKPSPGMTGWQYKNFASSNFIVGTPKYIGEDESVVYTLKNDAGINITIAYSVVDGVVVVDTVAFNALNALKVGKYTFTAKVEGTTDYGDLEYEATVSVMKAANTWSQDPGMTSWSYKGYTAAGNFTAGDPYLQEDDDAVVTYKITKVGDNNFTEITFTNIADVKTQLENLQVGSYIMTATYPGTDNYDPLNRGNITFSVNKIQNTWVTRPGLTGWVYESFNEANFTAGVPTLTESKNQDGSDAEVEYTITKDGDNTFTAITFTKLSDVQTKLEKLAVGSYTMTVTYPGTDNYDRLDPDVTFIVSQRTNSWSATPRLSSYRYEQFAAASNFTAGEPYYPTDDKTVHYGIFNKNIATSALFIAENSGVKFNAVTDNITVSGKQMTVEDYLNTLSCGTYYFAAYVAGTNEYTELYTCTEFVVGQATNSWISGKVPYIGSWTYGEYVNGTFTVGEATFGAVLYTVQKVDAAGNVITGETGIAKIGNNKLENMTFDDLTAVLSQLGADRYNLHATTGETNEYTAASQDIRFSVAMADNSWKNDTPPSIEGWTYGSAHNNHTNAEATVNTGAIIYTYYRAQLVNGEWINYGDNVALSDEMDAGEYVMKAVSPANANYNSLTHTVHFTIAKKANAWRSGSEPEDRLDWTWGATAKLSNSRLVNASATERSGGKVYTFANEAGLVIKTVTVKYVPGGFDEDDVSALLTALKELGVGNYRITTTVNETVNYGSIGKVTSVTVSAATFGVLKAPVCAGWTWGEDDGNKKYDDIEIETVVEGDPYTVSYTLGVKGQTAVDTFYDADEMFGELKGSNANTYVITVIVSGANYNELRRTVEVTIGKASFTWVSKPTDMTWTWREPKEIATPSAEYAPDKEVLLSYTLKIDDSPVVDYGTDFDSLLSLLTTGDIGTYAVTVSAKEGEGYDYELVNYNTFGTSFTVTVTKATNVWTENLPASRYEREYQNKDINVLEAKAKFGTVIYRDENGAQLMGDHGAITTVEALNELLNGLAANGNTPFVYYTVVVGTVNYDTISEKTEVFVTGTKSKWQNTVELTERINLTYSNNLSADFAEKVNEYIPVGPSAGTTTYTISYVNADSENPDQNDTAITSAAKVLEWLQGKGMAGTYVIYSYYQPDDGSYTPLEHTLTVKVARARPQFDVTLKSLYEGTYGTIVVPDPTVTGFGAPIKITITDIYNNEYPIPEGMSFSEFVKTLDAVSTYYSVSYSVEQHENYYGINPRQSMLYIRPIVNSWNNSTIGENTVVWDNGYTWTYTRGEAVSVKVPTAVTGNDTLKIIFDDIERTYNTEEAFNNYLKTANLSAGRHTLVYSIKETVNYNGLTSNCSIVINRKSNSWTTEIANYVGEGAVSGFALPETDNHIVTYNGKDYDLLRFDVSRADGKYGRTCISLSDFEADLATFANGTYTVTAYVGGTGYASSLSDDYKAALALYNADYEAIVTTCTITLTPNANAWTTPLAGHSWTWGEFDGDEITKPVASYGNDTVVYTIKRGNSTVATLNASDYGNDGEALFVAFKDALEDLDAGTYSVTVSMSGDDIYYAPEATSAVFIVSPATSAWTLSDSELAGFELITVTWGSISENAFPELELAPFVKPWSGEGSTIVYSISGEDLDCSWANALRQRSAGRYTITATVKGDTNHTLLSFRAIVNVNPVTSKWDATTIANNGGEIDWIYKDTANNVNPAEPVIGLTEAEIGDDWDTTPAYKLTKKSQNGTLELYSGNSWSTLLGKLADQSGGEYTLTAHIDGDTNHTALDYEFTVVVSAAVNSWNKHMSELVDETNAIEWVYKVGGTAIEFEAKYNNAKLVITVNGDVVTDIDDLKDLPIGEYQIVATVDADETYGGLTETIKLRITKAANTWMNEVSINNWNWNDIGQQPNGWATGFIAPIPEQGTSANVTVTLGSTVVLEATLTYNVSDGVKTVNQNDLDALGRRLCALNVGKYKLSVTVGETDNYSALDGEENTQSCEFEIRQASNRWETKPTIEGWSIDGDTAYPKAIPLFGKGTVVFSYAVASDNEDEPAADAVWLPAPAYAEGSYWLRASVEGTDNYSALVGHHKFTIKAGKNAWVNNPGVVPWNWNGYDKDVNLFSGSARSNGKATFTVTKANNTSAGLPLTTGDFFTTDSSLVIDEDTILALDGFELDAAGKVSDSVAKLLKALKDGTYRLNVTVAAGNNLEEISGGTVFTVGKAENSWATDSTTGKLLAPSVRYYNYGESGVFTAGTPSYGTTVSYMVTSGTEYTSEVITDTDKLEELLSDLDVGSYVLNAWVTATVNDTYKPFYSQSSSYQVAFVVSPIANAFVTAPKTSVSEYYSVIHAEGFDLDTWLGRPVAAFGDGEETYTILSTDYTPLNNKTYTYEQFKTAVLEELNSGEYIIRITVASSSANYRVLTGDMSLAINRYNNKFTAAPNKLTGQWRRGSDGKNDTLLDAAIVRALYGKVAFTLNGTTYASYSELENAVKALDASSYQVTYEVIETNEHTGLTKVVQLDVAQASNAWQNGWVITSSLTVNDSSKANTASLWNWHSEVTWNNAVPTYGNTVYVEIKVKGASSSLRYITIDYSVANYADAIDTVCSALSSLDVGNYVMTVTAPAGSNWTQISSSTEFTVKKVDNRWTSDYTVIGAEETSAGVFTVTYGNTAIPSVTSLYGVPEYEFYLPGATKPLTAMPTNAGEYRLRFVVYEPDSGNYGLIEDSVTFKIVKADVTSFIVSPGTTGWIWGDYNRMTNVFTGIPTSGGKVSYTVLDKDGKVVTVTGVAVEENGETKLIDVVLDNILLGDAEGTHHDDFDKDLYVSTKIGTAMAKLKAGTYTLRINVAATDNNTDFPATTTFVVTAAENIWTTPPQVVSWVSNNWNEDEYMPKANSRFGNPHIVIRSSVTDDVYFEANYNSVTGKLEIIGDNLLNSAPTGWYSMRATVAASENEYNNELDNTISFQIFAQGSPDEKNYWIDTPGIEPWAANIENKINLPYGKPARGLPYFLFYKAEYNGTSYTRGELVTKGELAYTVSRTVDGSVKYYQDFYVPIAPGHYYMVACAVSVDINGNVVEKDNLDTDKTPMLFEIFNRDNSWEQDVRITSLLYLGERKDWAGPNAKAYLPDSVITYKYFDAETREDIGSEMPAKDGKYIVVASATARFSATITSEIEFEVRYSKNYWVGDKSPTIDNWSEEFSSDSPDPVGEAMFGEVTYIYYNKSDYEQGNLDTPLTEKPTKEGEYTMIARVEIEGYETLESPYDFTIMPAYDRTFVIIDIILGVVACSMAVVVFIFAVRRYKEN